MRAAVVLRNAAKAAKAGESAAAAGKQTPMSADQSLYHLEPEVSCCSAPLSSLRSCLGRMTRSGPEDHKSLPSSLWNIS